MTTLSNDFVGQTSGTTVTTANSGASGTAFTAVTITAGSTLTYDATEMITGKPSVHATVAGTAVATFGTWALPAAWGTVYSRCTYKAAAYPNVINDFAQFVTVTGGTVSRMRLRWTTTGQLALVNTSTVVATTTDSYPLGATVVVEAAFTLSTAGAGTFTGSFYTPGGTAPSTATVSASNLTTNGDTVEQVRWFVPIANPTSYDAYFGTLAVSDTGPLGDPSPAASSAWTSSYDVRIGG